MTRAAARGFAGNATKLNGYVTGITEQQLEDAPAFSDDPWSDRNWEKQTYQHYNVRLYR